MSELVEILQRTGNDLGNLCISLDDQQVDFYGRQERLRVQNIEKEGWGFTPKTIIVGLACCNDGSLSPVIYEEDTKRWGLRRR